MEDGEIVSSSKRARRLSVSAPADSTIGWGVLSYLMCDLLTLGCFALGSSTKRVARSERSLRLGMAMIVVEEGGEETEVVEERVGI